MSLEKNFSRRHLLFGAAYLAAAVGGGFVLGALKHAHPVSLLRPPGARDEHDFLGACLRCGRCIEACPQDALMLAHAGEGVALGTPFFVARSEPCNLCKGHDDLECIKVCPSTALQPVVDEAGQTAREKVRIGIAKINRDTCWAWNNTVCRACWHACPFPDEAIRLDERGRAIIVEDKCVGCGLCEWACLMEVSAVEMVPRGAEA